MDIQKKSFIKDGVVPSVIDDYIRSSCNHHPYVALLTKEKVATNNELLVAVTTSKHVPCQHDIYEEEITYTKEINASFCRSGYYLFGVLCGGCQATFVPRATTDQHHTMVVPTVNAPAYCCVNITGGDNGSIGDEGSDVCRHAV